MATKQIMKLEWHGRKFSIVYHSGKTNPYYLYRHTWVARDGGYCTERRTIEVKYADLKSCLLYLFMAF